MFVAPDRPILSRGEGESSIGYRNIQSDSVED